ncbi:hypothetical protein F0562_030218 [Nyssa sinensis]|uniref:Uncharacterized protein n=1 Tax=Nyssa sinensis TaxID=561372 RepID=A0A5J5AVT9_9ASTE|nr:hypothetical protein F0562_030218 [Nyssa sinensis]
MLSGQLEAQNTNIQLDREQRKDNVSSLVAVLKADLVRNMKLPVTVDFIQAESYGFGTESNDAPKMSFDLKIDFEGKHVILNRMALERNRMMLLGLPSI